MSFRRLLTCSGLVDLPERKSTSSPLPRPPTPTPTCVGCALPPFFSSSQHPQRCERASGLTTAPVPQPRPPPLPGRFCSQGRPGEQVHATCLEKSHRVSPKCLRRVSHWSACFAYFRSPHNLKRWLLGSSQVPDEETEARDTKWLYALKKNAHGAALLRFDPGPARARSQPQPRPGPRPGAVLQLLNHQHGFPPEPY